MFVTQKQLKDFEARLARKVKEYVTRNTTTRLSSTGVVDFDDVARAVEPIIKERREKDRQRWGEAETSAEKHGCDCAVCAGVHIIQADSLGEAFAKLEKEVNTNMANRDAETELAEAFESLCKAMGAKMTAIKMALKTVAASMAKAHEDYNAAMRAAEEAATDDDQRKTGIEDAAALLNADFTGQPISVTVNLTDIDKVTNKIAAMQKQVSDVIAAHEAAHKPAESPQEGAVDHSKEVPSPQKSRMMHHFEMAHKVAVYALGLTNGIDAINIMETAINYMKNNAF